jgi:peptidoglycan/LPS O-acetylase OafA/YrhL
VDLFFVLSGFLIGGILLEQREAINHYQVFYLRRFYRIVPLYALLVLPGLIALVLGMQSIFGGHSLAHQSTLSLWLCVCFLQNFCSLFHLSLPNYLGPTWSVAVEEQFYLLLPLLARSLHPRKLLKILAILILCAPLLRIVLFYSMGQEGMPNCYALLPCRWDSLLLGVIAAIICRDPQYRAWFAGRIGGLSRVCWLLALCSMALLFVTDGPFDPRMACVGYTLIDGFFACSLLLAVINPAGTLHRLLSLQFFSPIARISYGLYLLHIAMLALAESAFRAMHLQFVKVSWTETMAAMLALGFTFLAATLSWKFFESPLIRRGHQHHYEHPPRLKEAKEFLPPDADEGVPRLPYNGS